MVGSVCKVEENEEPRSHFLSWKQSWILHHESFIIKKPLRWYVPCLFEHNIMSQGQEELKGQSWR